MNIRFKRNSKFLLLAVSIVLLFSIFKTWVAFSMSNFLLVEDVSVLAKSDTLDENLANI